MKGRHRVWVCLLLSMLSCTLYAAEAAAAAASADPEPPPCQSATDCLQLISQYIKRLGADLGFNLMKPIDGTPIISTLHETLPSIRNKETNLLQTYLGALTTTTISQKGQPQFYNLVASAPDSPLNKSLDATYAYLDTTQSTDSTASTSSLLSLVQNTQIDQQPYQADPVSQTLLNLLTTTPNDYNCPTGDTNAAANKHCLTQPTILTQVVPLPTPLTNIYSTQSTSASGSGSGADNPLFDLITQLNENTLITPLMISNGQSPSTSGSTSDVTAQQASAFIRYASGTMIPPTLPDFNSISKALTYNPDSKTPSAQQLAIQTYLSNYRTYLAQVSVGVSNLYYLLSKRLPQPDAQNAQSSQALNEYKMATWRLYEQPSEPQKGGDQQQKPNEQWLTYIDKASSATVQKEMVTLLAEINYQLYLSRQQQERLLATNSVLLLMSAKSTLPDASALTNALSTTSNPSGSDSGSSTPTLPGKQE